MKPDSLNQAGRLAIVLSLVYFILMLSVVLYGRISYDDITSYQITEERRMAYEQFLYPTLLGLAIGLAVCTALFGVWRQKLWHGLAALAAGAIITVAALSFLPWTYFPNDQYPASFSWIYGGGIPMILTWLLVTFIGRMQLKQKVTMATL